MATSVNPPGPPVTDFALDAHSVIVMAHPDDEVLWASSALARAGRLVLANEALPGRPDITQGRQAAAPKEPVSASRRLSTARGKRASAARRPSVTLGRPGSAS